MTSKGTLHYDENPLKLVLLADQDLADYYRCLLPKSMQANRPRHQAHVSIVRKIIPPKMSYWSIYEGEEVEFIYEPKLAWDKLYIWLPVKCRRFEEIRVELGLEAIVPWRNGFHLTVGNFKDI